MDENLVALCAQSPPPLPGPPAPNGTSLAPATAVTPNVSRDPFEDGFEFVLDMEEDEGSAILLSPGGVPVG